VSLPDRAAYCRVGEITRTASTDAMPDRVIYKPCGNRRDRACPGCAETYRRDAFQLIRAGLAGGKGVPATVAAHPAVFATFTAPSFGPVHTRPVRRHTCTDRAHCRCKPEPCHARRDAGTCPHGRPAACWRRHSPGDVRLGQPLCPDCYDYNGHVVWNNSAGELWRRTKQDIERHLGALARRRGLPPVRLSHGKAAEYQARGAVHFHVLLRLDGIDRADPARIIPPPAGITAADLERAIRRTVRTISYRTEPHPASPAGWVTGWGTELDIRVIAMRGTGTVTSLAVASYLAKYSVKGTEPAGHVSARITPATIGLYAKADGTHPERLIHACWTLGTVPDYAGLRRWAHMLGFGGHFLTKARRYSVTLTALRQARITYRRHQDTGPEHGPLDSRDDDAETML
jgi:Replication initiator protein, pSAM2